MFACEDFKELGTEPSGTGKKVAGEIKEGGGGGGENASVMLISENGVKHIL